MVRLYYNIKYRGTIAPDAATGHSGVMKRTVVWLTNEQVEALAAMSKKSLAPLSALVRQAVKEFLRDKRKRRA
jgi:Ribbon-helix-helix domain